MCSTKNEHGKNVNHGTIRTRNEKKQFNFQAAIYRIEEHYRINLYLVATRKTRENEVLDQLCSRENPLFCDQNG